MYTSGIQGRHLQISKDAKPPVLDVILNPLAAAAELIMTVELDDYCSTRALLKPQRSDFQAAWCTM